MKKEYLTKQIRSDKDKVLMYMKTFILIIKNHPEKFKDNKYKKEFIDKNDINKK